MRKVLIVLGAIAVVAALGFSGFVAWSLYPHDNPLPLPPPLVASTSAEGMERLRNAEASADYNPLAGSFQAQIVVSYCGVATSVAVLDALGIETSQFGFFTDEAGRVRSQRSVMFGGMSLGQLAGLLETYGVDTSIHYADEFSADEFRSAVEENLTTPDDYLIVNYQREVLGQGRVGHISPVAAYDQDTDSVLIMDTAAHKYPPTWVPIDMLHEGMRAIVASTGKARGYVEVTK